MATTKKRSTTSSRSTRTSSRKQKQSVAARAGRTVRDRPYASAAIATSAVTAVAALAAGAFFFSRSNRSLKETTDDISGRVKDGLAEAKVKAKSVAGRVKSRLDGHAEKSQAEIAEEALTLKDTGAKTNKPVDPMVSDQLKAGAVAY
ncbi:hypothetical protein [Sphingomonas edaphi]|uniref:YtxH domain-containing protein n=1 Tax=Sphingomonas edaphi TaxID=2315689 RepID=A0A418PY33_9SPHN|nr:hypothetical protein [Sphingomonas edaphi]RIX26994.1 hypothetical protein D3M59_10580 [Sphingomonas edaphi]